MLSWTTCIVAVLLVVGSWLLVSCATKKVKGRLRKAGVTLTYSSLSLSSITGLQLQLASGPLHSLSVDSIGWRGRASSSSTQAGSSADGDHHSRRAAAWLPISIAGVTAVVSKAASNSSKRRRKGSKSHGPRSPAAAAAARPAVSTVLAVARRLLPGVAITVHSVTVEFKDQGVALHLRKAAVHWTSDAPASTLWSALLLHDLSLVAGSTACAEGPDGPAAFSCPVAQVSAGLIASKGPVPISCTELQVQVGTLKLYGLSQLMLLAEAAAEARPLAAAKVSAAGAGSLGSDGPLVEVHRPAGKSSKPPAGKVLEAVAWLPEKVKVSVAGAQLLPCKPLPQQRCSILQLPVVLGSLGAVSVAASSCQKPAAAKPGVKMLSMSLTVGPLELSAASQASSVSTTGIPHVPGSKAAVVFTLPGITTSLHLAKVPGVGLQPGSRAGTGAVSGSGAGRSSTSGREGLRLRQQAAQPEQPQQEGQSQQQQWVLKATCNCQLKQQLQLQVHSAQLPPLLRSVQLLQVSMQQLKDQKQAVAAQAAVAAAARHAEELGSDDRPPANSLSPAASLSSLPRPETPSLLTPCMSPTPNPPSPPESAGGAVTPARAPEAAAAGASTTSAAAAAAAGGADDPAGRRRLGSFGSGVLNRLPSKLFGGGGADVRDAQLGLVAELSVVTEGGLSVEVTDSNGNVAVWLSLQEVDAGAAAEWAPAATSTDGRRWRSNQHEQDTKETLQLSTHALLQQLTVSVAPCPELAAQHPAAFTKSAGGQGRVSLHKLVQLDSASVQVSSNEDDGVLQGPALVPDTGTPLAKQPLHLQLLALAGQLQVAASVAALQPLLTLAQHVYQPAPRHVSAAAGGSLSAEGCATAAGAADYSQLPVFDSAAAVPSKAVKKPKVKKVVLAVVEVQLQSCGVSLAHTLSTASTTATETAKHAAAAGVQTQLLLSLSGMQLSVLPLQQQLGASLELLQVGYQLTSTGAAVSSNLQLKQQSVELLRVQAVHFRHHHAEGLQLLKVAAQQLRSDIHIDVVLAGVSVASAVLQQSLSCVQQLQLRHASAAAATASQQAAAAAIVAGVTGQLQAAQDAAVVAYLTAAALDEQGLIRGDSFSALAVQPILDGIQAGTDACAAAAAGLASGPSGSATLPPAAVRPGSSCGSLRTAPRPAKQKPLLALEARVCDLAVQLSVCDNDALLVQMDQLNYSSILEQAVITKLRFAINDRSIVQVPHAAVGNLPGWLPPGITSVAAAAAAAAAMQKTRGFSWSAGSREGFTFSNDAGQSSAAPAPSEAGPDAATSQQQEQAPTGATASWQDGAAGEGGCMTSLAFLDSPLPCSSLGSRRPSADADPALYQRQAARQAAGRERCKVAAAAAGHATGSDGAGDGAAAGAAAGARPAKSSISFSRSNEGAKGAGAAADDRAGAAAVGTVISLNVYAERVLVSVPHDEAPGRIIVVTETWAKAVKEVLKPRLTAMKSTIAALKAGMLALKASCGSSSSSIGPRASKTKPPKPAYLELVVNLQQIVFSLQQHPLETWVGLHGPLLQCVAAERHLTEQLLASCASAHGRISRSGGGTAGKEGVVAGRGGGRQPQRFGSGRKQAKQWGQKGRWGTLGKKGGAAVLVGIAAGSVVGRTDAAGAAAAEAAVAAAGPLAAAITTPRGGAPPGAPQATAAPAAGPVSDTAGPPTPQSTAAATRSSSDADTAAAADLSDADVAHGDVSPEESTTDSDSSDDEGPMRHNMGGLDADALAAALPSSAHELAAGDEQGGAGPAQAARQPGADAGPPAGARGASAAPVVPIDPAAAEAVLSAAAASGDAANGNAEMAQAVLQAHRELFEMYKYRCRPLDAAAEDEYHHSRAVMHVSCSRAEGVVLICLPGNAAADAMAHEVICRVDPPSEGVEMARTQSISLDVGGHDVVAHFGGVEEMASTIGSVQASGLLVRARQVCAPPSTRPMRMAVGRWHAADVPVVVKGTRPPMKMYTDLKAELEDVQGAFCPGLEAPFGQLNIAFKRLVTPNALNPDGTVPPSVHPGLPWWDMMRYMWRGLASIRVRNLTAVLANTLDPHVRPRDERLALTAATLSISLAAGRIDLTTTNITAHAHALPPDSSLGDAMLVLPAFHLPLAVLTFNISTKLPGGRNPMFHHVFPILTAAPPANSPLQEMVDVFSLMKSEGWSLGIDIAVNSDKTFTHGRGGVAAAAAAAAGVSSSGAAPTTSAGVPLGGPVGAAGSCWHYYQPYNLPHAFIGEFQIKYIIDLVDGFVNASPIVRYSRKLKPFYVRDRRPEAAEAARAVAAVRASIVQMPLLKQRIEINLTADVFRVHHDAQDADDPSDMAYIALSSVRYSNTFTYSRYKRSLQLSNGPRLKDSMRQYMASLSVEAYDLKIVKPQADEPLNNMLSSAQWGPGPVCQSPGPWAAEQQQQTGAGSVSASQGGLPTSSSFKKSGLGPESTLKVAVELRTPPRSAVAATAATGSTVASGSPRSGPSATKSPLVHGRTAAGPSSNRRGADAAAAGMDGAEDGTETPGFGQGLIAAAACFLLRQAPPEAASAAASGPAGSLAAAAVAAAGQLSVDPAPVPKRPIRMIAQDVKLLCPAELRDTCMLLFHHMQKAFSGITFGGPKGPVRISTKQQQQQQADGNASGGSSPRINRSQSDGMQPGSTSLSRSSLGPVGSLRRHGSSDTVPATDFAASAGGNSSPSVASGSVNTPAEEDLMLQTILGQNAAATAAAAAAERKRAAARAREQARSGSNGGISGGGASVAADSFVSSVSSSLNAGPGGLIGGQDGLGHAASAVRALRGAGSTAVGQSAFGLDDDGLHESPHSAALSDISHLSATDSSVALSAAGPSGVAAEQHAAQGGSMGGGLSVVEQMLLEYEIEFVQVQVNLVSDSARGSLVLGTNSALLMGHLNTARLERSVSFKMDQVQAHVVCSEMEPQRGPLWLKIANGKLSTPPGAEGIMRQVLLPFKCQLVTTKQAQSSATATALNAAATGPGSVGPASAASSMQNLQQQQQPAQRSQQQQLGGTAGGSMGGMQAAVPAGSAAQELRLHVPTIGARLDSRQFEVLMDVIQNIAMAPLPTFPPPVKGMWQHPDGISEDDDNQDVMYALETLQSLRERQRCLEQELLAVLAAQQQYAAWQARNVSPSSLTSLQQHVLAPSVAAGMAGLRSESVWPQQQQQQQVVPYTTSTYTASSVTWGDMVSSVSSVSGDSGYASTYHTSSISAPTASVMWQADRGALAAPAPCTGIKEASISLVLALAAAGTAAERKQQQLLANTAGGSLQQLQLLKGSHPAANSIICHLGGASGSTAGGRPQLGGATPAGSNANLAALQQQEQLVLVAERPTLVWWAQEQLQGALDAITATRTVLELLRSEAGLLKVRQRNAMGVDITVDTIDWALSKGSTVIVQGELQGISYQSIRSEDHTGTTKIQLHTATFRDPQQQQQAATAAAAAAAAAVSAAAAVAASKSSHSALLEYTPFGEAAAQGGSTDAAGASGTLPPLLQCSTPRELSAAAAADNSAQQAADAAAAAAAAAATAAAEAGLILAPWNPDESWEADELVRIYAIHGAMEARHVVYEHIEVLVHPIRVHLTAALAGALQDYFNLREEEGGTKESKPAGRAQEAAAARAAKQAARDDKRRLTAPGDLTSGPSGTGHSMTSPSSLSPAPPLGPLTAAAVKKPSLFSRRAAVAAASAVGVQPLVAVPSSDWDAASAPSMDAGARSVASTPTVDSPAVDYSLLPPPLLASGMPGLSGLGPDAAGAGTSASVAEPSVDVHDSSACGRGAAEAVSLSSMAHAASTAALAAAAGADAALAPVLLYQGTVCDWSVVLPTEALGLRYGAVKRSRLGRVGVSIRYPGSAMVAITPSAAAAGAAAGASVGGTGPAAGAGAGGAAAGQARATPSRQAAAGGLAGAGPGRSQAPPVRSIKFKHVRFNRAHARLTYESPAFSVRGFGLVLDNRVYRNIDGGWKTVLNRYKWDLVRSLLKSATGMQAKKLQELQIPNYGAEPPDSLELRSSAGFRAGIMSLLKGRKGRGAKLKLGGGPGAAGESSFSDELEGLAPGSAGGDGFEDGGGAGDVDGSGAGGAGADYKELMRSAIRLKHKQRKMQLLLGTVPPLLLQPGAAVALG